jgi:hypothetical protein
MSAAKSKQPDLHQTVVRKTFKSVYATPELVRLGYVHELTKSGVGSKQDGCATLNHNNGRKCN